MLVKNLICLAKVVGTYNNGETRDLTIKWNEYDKESLNKIGEFTITGKLQDSEAVVTVTVHVIGNVVAMENYSTVTSAELHRYYHKRFEDFMKMEIIVRLFRLNGIFPLMLLK